MFDLIASLIGILGFTLACISLYWTWNKEKKRNPKLKVKLEKAIHGYRTKNVDTIVIRNETIITNEGEWSTTISKVRFHLQSIKTSDISEGSVNLKTPIRIRGKDTIIFRKEIFAEKVIPEKDCNLSLEFFYANGSTKSNKVISKYHKIVPPPCTPFNKPKS